MKVIDHGIADADVAQLNDAFLKWQVLEITARLHAMLVGCGNSPKLYILVHRINAALQKLQDFTDGKIKRLPKKLY